MRTNQAAYVKRVLQPADSKSVEYMMFFLLSGEEAIPETTSSNHTTPTRVNEGLPTRKLKFLIFSHILINQDVADFIPRQLMWLVAHKLRL